MLSRINGLLNYCYQNAREDELPNIELQLFLIAVKCLIPFENDIGCYFDLDRYKKEIELFKYYKNGNDKNLECYFENKGSSQIYDNLLEYKLIPIIIANTQWDNLLNEALNATMFYSINSGALLNTILISSIINEYLNDNLENINETTKERLINFSLKALFIRSNIQINKKNLIEFEKERIGMLSKDELITDELIDKFKSLQYIYNVVKNENENENENKSKDIINETLLYNFSSYLYKLRKGVINPEKLKVSMNNILDINEYLRYSSFSHPLLGKCRVLKRGEKEVILRNKTGLIKVNI